MDNREYIKDNIDVLPEGVIVKLEEFINLRINQKLFKSIGKIDDENCKDLLEILKDCEKIDYDEW